MSGSDGLPGPAERRRDHGPRHLYGLLFLWGKSTRPGILAHAWSDVYAGLQMRFLPSLPGL